MVATPRRIFVNVTRTYFQGSRSGVPRVVRKIVEAFAARHDMDLVCFVFHAGSFCRVWASGLKDRDRTAHFLRRIYRRSGLQKMKPGLVTGLIAGLWQSFCNLRVARNPLPEITDFGPADTILLLDNEFRPEFLAALGSARNGARIVGTVYDLFALTHPEIYGPEVERNFAEGFAKLVALCDRLVCLSGSVANAVRAYLAAHGIDKPVSHFYLGSDISPAAATTPPASRAVPVLLSVSALDPRKNYPFAIALCNRLWTGGLSFRYVIVGEQTSTSGDLARRIRKHPRFGRDLFYLENVADEQLVALYGQADLFLNTSLEEGFGIPVMEAFRHGVAVACSDIPVYRETCGMEAVFLPLDDAEKSAALLRQALENPQPAKAAPPGLCSWQQSAGWLLREIG